MSFLKPACLWIPASALLIGCIGKQSTPLAKSEPDFIAAFRQAHEGRDLEALSKLVCWDRVPLEIRKLSEDSFRATFDDKIMNIRVTTEHPQGRPEAYVRNGITYRFNVPVVAEMVVENPPPTKVAFGGTYYPLGVKDGRYCIAQMAPTERSDAQESSVSTRPPVQAIPPSQSGKAGQSAVVPVKTVLIVRLAGDLGIKAANAGGGFSATTVQPVVVNGITLIPAGSLVEGIVTKKGNYSPDATLTSVTVNGTSHKISTESMTFNEQIVFPAGSEMKFELVFPLKLNQ
jgi:hypothetical protein